MAHVTLEDLAKQSGLTRAILYKYVKTCKEVLGELRRGEDNRILLSEEQAELLLKIRGLNRLEGVPLTQVMEKLQAGETTEIEVSRIGFPGDVSGLIAGLAKSLNRIEERLDSQAKAIESLSASQDEAEALRRENRELRRKILSERGIQPVLPVQIKAKPSELPWYLRWWYELVAPEKLRANTERSLSPA